jgi:hypothetical protein
MTFDPTGWDYSTTLVIDSSKIDEDLVDFPALMSIASGTGINNYDLSNVFTKLDYDPNVSGTSLLNHCVGDSSWSRHNITYYGGAIISGTSSLNDTDYCYYFDGLDDYLLIPSSSDWAFGTEDFTVDFWIEPYGSTNERDIVFRIAAYLEITLGYSTASDWSTGGLYIGVHIYYNGSVWAFQLASTSALTSGQWSHVAVVKNSGAISIYINGVASGSSNNSTSIVAADLYIGSNPSDRRFKGNLALIRVTKGVAKWTSDFQLDSVIGSYIPDKDTRLLLLPEGDLSTPVKYMSFTNVQSYSGYGIFEKSYYFNGLSSYISIPASSDFYFNNQDFTIDFWVNFSVVSTQQTLLNVWQNTSVNGSWYLYLSSGNKICWYPQGYFAGAGTLITGAKTISANIWYHISLCYNGKITSCYINGEQDSYYAGPILGISTQPLIIGINGNTFSDHYLNGYISELRINNGNCLFDNTFIPTNEKEIPAEAEDILYIHSTMDDVDSSRQINFYNNATISGTTVSGFNYCCNFDGTSYLQLPSSDDWTFGTGPFTIDMYVNMSAIGTGRALISNRPSSGASADMWSFEIFGGQLEFHSGLVEMINNGGTPTSNTFTHIAVVREGTNQTKIYKDGIATASGTVSNNFATTRPLNIGKDLLDGGTVIPFVGSMYGVRITKGEALWTSNFTPPTYPYTTTSGTKLLLSFDGDISNYKNPVSFVGNLIKKYYFNYHATITTEKKSVSYAAYNSWASITTNAHADFGRYYFEVIVDQGSSTHHMVGIGNPTGFYPGDNTTSYGYYGNSGNTYYNALPTAYGNTFAVGDVVGVAVDHYTGSVWFSKNGVWQASGNPTTGENPAFTGSSFLKNRAVPVKPIVGLYTTSTATFRFNSNEFSYSPPSNFVPIGTLLSFKQSLYFNGSTSYLYTPYDPSINLGIGDFTMEAWVYPTDVSVAKCLFSQGAMDAAGDGTWALQYGTDGAWGSGVKIVFATRASGASSFIAVSAPGLTTNQWHHVALVRMDGYLYFYLNGFFLSKTTHSASLGCTNKAIRVGGRMNSSENNIIQFTAGYIAYPRITKGIPNYYKIGFDYPKDEYGKSWHNRKSMAVTTTVSGIETELYTEISDWENRYVSVYPKIINTTTVIATSYHDSNYLPWFAVDPTITVLGNHANATWASGNGQITNQKFNIDLGESKIIKRFYIENGHSSGGVTNMGAKNFSIYGSNSSAAFSNTTYSNIDDLTLLGTFTARDHVAIDRIDKQFFYLDNNQSFRYYIFRVADNISGGGTNILIRKICLYEYVNKASLWTKVPTVDSISYTQLKLYYDKNKPASQYIGDVGDFSAQKVWSNNYSAVYHLNQNPVYGTDSIKDSTKYQLHGTPQGSMIEADSIVNGQVGRALDFDGSNDLIALKDSSNFNFGTGDFTIEGGIYIVGPNTIFSNSSSANKFHALYVDSGLAYGVTFVNGSVYVDNIATVTGTWQYYNLVRSGSNLIAYMDLVQKDSSTSVSGVSIGANTSNAIGGSVGYSQSFKGHIDEVRISSIARSDAWRKATYYSLNDGLLQSISEFFAFSNIIPENGSTVYGQTKQLSAIVTMSGLPDSSFSVDFYDIYNAHIGSTVSGVHSGDTVYVDFDTPSGIEYKWYIETTTTGVTNTSEVFNFYNRFTFNGWASDLGTRSSGVPIYLHRSSTGEVVDYTNTATESGTFMVSSPYAGEPHYVVALPPRDTFNAMIFDRIIP